MARTTGSNGEETEARIRSCALSLIADHGFEAMSMRRLAAAVGVQSAALYRYFPTKQALLAELMTSHMKQLLAAWTAATPDNSAAPLARLDAFARFHIRYHLARPHEVFIAYMELRSLSPAHYVAVGTLRSTYEDVLKEILIDGSQRGDFQLDDIHVTAMAMLAMLTAQCLIAFCHCHHHQHRRGRRRAALWTYRRTISPRIFRGFVFDLCSPNPR